MKTCWKDVGMGAALRKPNSRWQVWNCARWVERLLGVAEGTIVLVRPDGTLAKPPDTIGSLR